MRTRYATTTAAPAVGSPDPQRIRWGAVFAGAVLGIALLTLLTTLWFALAYGTGNDQIRTNLEWYVGISAIVCLFVAGLLAGWLSGVHGFGSGFFNGMTIWGLMLILTLSVGVPAVMNVFNLGRVAQFDAETGGLLSTDADNVLWATFFAILGGLIASGLGGAIGGAMTRPANAHLYDEDVRTEVVERPDRERVVERPDRPDRETVVVGEAEDVDVDEDERARYHRAS
jgi:hypothetical protein